MRERLLLTLSVMLFALGLVIASQPKVSAQFVGQQTWGATSGGTANAQTISIPNLSSNITGLVLSFLVGPGLTNTGPVTINVTGIGAATLQRQTITGLFALSSGELQAGMIANIMYNGSVYELLNTAGQPAIGTSIGYRGTSVPSGYLVEDGTCFSTSGIYAPLFSIISTTYNANAPVACSGGQFAVPYSNGAAFLAADAQGAHTAGRVTNGGSGCSVGGSAGVFCGVQSVAISTGQLVAHTHGNVEPVPPHTHSFTGPTVAASATGGSGISGNAGSSNTTGVNSSGGLNISINNAGSGAAHSVLNPILVGQRGIKY